MALHKAMDFQNIYQNFVKIMKNQRTFAWAIKIYVSLKIQGRGMRKNSYAF